MVDYSTQTYLGMLSSMQRPRRFLLELFFTREQQFDTAEVVFEKVKASRRLAPFVSPLVAGKPMPTRGKVEKTFTPPYLKPKHVVDPTMALKRRAGETIQAQLSPEQRLEAIRLELLEDQDDYITRREEWMGVQLLLDGAMEVVAEDHPPMSIDLGRNALNTGALTLGARWGEAGVSPFAWLRARAAEVAARSGSAPRTVVMDPLAAELFLADPKVEKVLLSGNMPTGSAAQLLGALGDQDEAVYLGSIGGFTFWQYQSTYVDAAGATHNLLPDYTVIMGSPSGAEGIRLYGAILDVDVMRALTRFPKEWVKDDPSVRYLMTQSAPLPVMGNPDAVLAYQVR